jgi:hypothetical protein
LSVSPETRELRLYNIVTGSPRLASNGRELPTIPCDWTFTGPDIRRISLHNDDPLCLYL